MSEPINEPQVKVAYRPAFCSPDTLSKDAQIDWLFSALCRCLAVMSKAETDLAITPVEMTAEQFEELQLRVADELGDEFAKITQLGELAGVDWSQANSK